MIGRIVAVLKKRETELKGQEEPDQGKEFEGRTPGDQGAAFLAEALFGIAEGRIPEGLPADLPAYLIQVREGVARLMDSLQGFQGELDRVVDALTVKKRITRFDEEAFQGFWRDWGRKVNILLSGLSSFIKEVREWLSRVSEGDLTVRMSENNAMKVAFDRVTDRLNGLLVQIQTAVDQVSIGASQVAQAAQSLAEGAAQQASTVEEISSSAAEIEVQARQNAEKAVHANRLAQAAMEGARAGQGEMEEMVKAMGEIEESSTNISKIIKVIDEIAFQTNLLALNAAIEAARAGQYGKGFAVVAEEVRSLAQRSAEAARETAQLIEGAVQKSRYGVEIAQRAREAFNRIAESVQQVTELMGEIAAASNEQAQGVMHINAALRQIEQIVQQTAATAEENASAAEELSAQAAHLRELLGQFKVKRD